MSKETISIVCEECDSEYKITFVPGDVSGAPDMCAFCGGLIDLDAEEHDAEDETSEDESDDWN